MAATESHLEFSLALHRTIGGSERNSCFSPYSVASALSLAAKAARGATADELAALLGNVGQHTDLLKSAAKLAPETHREEPQLDVANTLWAWDELPLEDGFLADLASWPGAKVASAPFTTDPEAARGLINADVDQTTHGLIPELLPPGSIYPDTVATLVNALYLKAAWIHRFTEGATAPADFHTPSGTRQVPTMHLNERVGYRAAQGWQVVQLPAAGGVQAIILLPDGDLASAENALDASTLGGLLTGTRGQSVRLALPKLSLDVASPLKDVLKTLGVRTMFSHQADLSGLSRDSRLYVSDVLHQAVLRLDEEGFEGAAATALTMRLTSMAIDEPVTVTVDRPFLLLIRHAASGAVYFLARVVEP